MTIRLQFKNAHVIMKVYNLQLTLSLGSSLPGFEVGLHKTQKRTLAFQAFPILMLMSKINK